MGSPTVHVISTTKGELQTTLKSTLPLVNEPDARVIIVVSRSGGLAERAVATAEVHRWPISFTLLSRFCFS